MDPSISQLQEHSKAYLIIYIDSDDEIQLKVNINNELYLRAIGSKAIDIGNNLLDLVSGEEETIEEDE